MQSHQIFSLLVLLVMPLVHPQVLNDRPIIGILSEELTDKMTINYGPHKSYIASSYVQFVHGAGARVVPIMIGESQEYYMNILQKVNGVLLPGGSVWFDNKTAGYFQAGKYIIEEADRLNSIGDYFPLWGTCLGFELITFLQNNESEIRVNCSSYNVSSPLLFSPESSGGRLFSDVSPKVYNIAITKNSTSNFHRFCITRSGLEKSSLDWRILTTSTDDFGLEYISTSEHKLRPYYGTQWHPEKPLYEWGHLYIPHDQDTIQLSQYMADFFINEARKNYHKFLSEEDERNHLIYGHPATFGNPTSTYTQLYFFD